VYAPQYRLKSFETIATPAKFVILRALLEALTTANMVYLQTNPHTPFLYESGVRYLEEPPGFDEWQDVPDTIARRSGDCEDLACWRVAELRCGGEYGATHLITVEDMPDRNGQIVTTYHICVLRADGSKEDPSRRLGMP
jgi:hypothetical protein